jgi:hypothetical protein
VKIDTKKQIVLFDDTGRGDDFDVTKVLFENDDVILVTAENEWYSVYITAMIDKKDNSILCNELRFYYAKNKNIFCVALIIADNGQSSATCKHECDTISELEALKSDDTAGNISLIGWLPYEHYKGGDISGDDENFIHY